MAVKTCQYAQPQTQDTNRGPSASVWFDCPLEDMIQLPGGGIGTFGKTFGDDFEDFPGGGAGNNKETALGYWNTWIGNNAAALLGTDADTTNLPLEGGVLGLTMGSNNNLSITLAAANSAYRLISPATNFPMQGKLWFECRLAVSTIASGAFDLFCGLMDTGNAGTRITSAADTVFSAANTIKTAASMGGCIGFWKRATTNPADVAVVYNVNNGTAQLPGSGSDLQKLITNFGPASQTGFTAMSVTNGVPAANVFYKFGFVFDPTPSAQTLLAPAAITANQTKSNPYVSRVKFYVNGFQASAFLNTTDVQAATFPASFMAPVIGFRTGGTGAGVAYVDWIKVAQLGTL